MDRATSNWWVPIMFHLFIRVYVLHQRIDLGDHTYAHIGRQQRTNQWQLIAGRFGHVGLCHLCLVTKANVAETCCNQLSLVGSVTCTLIRTNSLFITIWASRMPRPTSIPYRQAMSLQNVRMHCTSHVYVFCFTCLCLTFVVTCILEERINMGHHQHVN